MCMCKLLHVVLMSVEAEDSIGLPEVGVAGHCELPDADAGMNTVVLEEQQELLSTDLAPPLPYFL